MLKQRRHPSVKTRNNIRNVKAEYYKRGFDHGYKMGYSTGKSEDTYERITCDGCNGTGKSSYGSELWQEHNCGRCNGTGYFLVKIKKVE